MNCVPWVFGTCHNCGRLSHSGNSVRPALEIGLYTSGVSCGHPQQGEDPPRPGHKGSGNYLMAARNHKNKKALQSFSLSRALANLTHRHLSPLTALLDYTIYHQGLSAQGQSQTG